MVLIVNGLSAQYHTSKGSVYAVDNVDFDLADGESIGIAGESACGKST
ncbi:MAG: ABC transporter ATP-binding protein, partial [Thermoproteota archaeon]